MKNFQKVFTKAIANASSHLLMRSAILVILMNAIAGMAIAKPTEAAETVNFKFNIFEVYVSVDDLDTFSKTGELRGALDMAARYISPKDMASFRRILTERADIPLVLLSRFLYTSQGERSLDILGNFITTGPNLSGNRAIRAAVLATVDKQKGLSLLNFLRKFPTSDIYFDIQEGLQTVGELSDLIQHTQKMVQMVNDEATKQAAINQTSSTQNPSTQLKNLRNKGEFTWERYSLKAPALDNKYQIPFYLFIPNDSHLDSELIPAIVISPGLMSNREPFLYLAEHLASYGFAVVLTISPNSSDEQLNKLIIGVANEIAPPQSFIERPHDITAVLNYLEKFPKVNNLNSTNINWKNVGMIGHSFGGYAALALVSDPQLQFADLAAACQGKYKWNPSLLLQCVALGLPNQAYKLGDPRIAAAIAVNPVTSHVLGKSALSKITVPIAIVSSSDDTFAPAVSEQIIPFTWLTSPNRYLLMLNGAGHTAVSEITASDRLSPEVSSVLAGPNPLASQNYLKLLSVAFFKTHLAKEPNYVNYLSSEYFANISTPSAKVSLLRSLSIEKIDAAIRN